MADTTTLTNDELASIYDYLRGNITQAQLAKEIGKIRTNTYYYLGRAVKYWLQTGTLRFDGVKSQADLGGCDIEPTRTAK